VPVSPDTVPPIVKPDGVDDEPVRGVPLHPNKTTKISVVKSDLIKTFVFIGVLVFNF
jgi:hypothetical protein